MKLIERNFDLQKLYSIYITYFMIFTFHISIEQKFCRIKSEDTIMIATILKISTNIKQFSDDSGGDSQTDPLVKSTLE